MIIHLRGRVAQGRWDDLVSFLRSAIPFYEEPGGIRVRLLRDAGAPTPAIGRQIGSDSLIMPDMCPGRPTARRLACSRRGSFVP